MKQIQGTYFENGFCKEKVIDPFYPKSIQANLSSLAIHALLSGQSNFPIFPQARQQQSYCITRQINS